MDILRLGLELREVRADGDAFDHGDLGGHFSRRLAGSARGNAAQVLDALAQGFHAGGFSGGTGCALFFAAGFVGLDLLVNRAFKREDFTLDALGFGVDQARTLQGRRLQFLALALKA